MSASLVAHRYRTHKRLGAGSFGEIFVGSDVNTGLRVAMKFEKHGLRCPQLRHEYKVYRELQGCRGVCKVQYYGTHNNFNVMVLDLLGPSLEELFTKCGRRFSLKTTLKLADQMLERCEALHGRHLIHRDVKPANFTMGDASSSPLVYCIDFGLSKRFRNPHTLQHIPHRVGKSLTGTPRYASISNHLGIEQSRRDDLEAVGYVLVYFAKGRLPWQGLKAKSAHKKYKLILDKKQELSIAQLCHGCPAQFAEYLSYCRSLKFDASPNVAYLRRLFRDLYSTSGHDVAQIAANDWDWMANADVRVDATTAQAYGARPDTAQARRATSARPGARPARPQSASAQRPANEEQFYAPPGRSASRGYDYGGDRYASRRPRTATARVGETDPERRWAARGSREAPAQPARRERPQSAAAAPSYQQRPSASSRSGGRGGDDGAHVVAGARSMMGLARARSARSAGGGARPRTSSRG